KRSDCSESARPRRCSCAGPSRGRSPYRDVPTPSQRQPTCPIFPMLSGFEMSDDRAFERRALREVVDVRRDAVEHEPQDIGVALVALADQCEATLETENVRIRLEVLGKLWIEQPRGADRKTRGRVWEVAREKR